MKIFLSIASAGMADETSGDMLPEHRSFIEQLLAGLRKAPNVTVFYAAEAEDWQLSGSLPEIAVKTDLQQIEQADLVLALTRNKPSAGVQFEIGYAAALNKRLVIALGTDEPLAYFNKGIVSLGLASEITYDSITALIQNATVAISAPADEVIT
jgi:nucleoside 2-deoxyribosyltransferase